MPSTLRSTARLTFVAAASLAASACAPIERAQITMSEVFSGPGTPRTVALDAAPAPIAKPSAPLAEDMRVRDLLTGETLTFDVSNPRAGTVRVAQSDGCVWTRWGDWFAPSDSWARCDDSRNWHTGEATVEPMASLWPLEVGSQGSFRRQALSHTGRSYERDTFCRAKDAVGVVRDNGETTPAIVVDCTDGKRVRTTWYAPGEGPVAFRKTHQENGVEEAWVRL